ncbi:MAG TPA: peptidoglycan bridge formation glycyltransferase FemA/FemB family protein [Rectinemataceae bacterium]|nr:peptidoglycan bridge formation glycyltransferase FemA/FemB family protein [Rectinemataceae bacterium]
MKVSLEALPATDSKARAIGAAASFVSPDLPFLQADFWSRFKESFGWRGLAFRLSVSAMPDPGSSTTELRVLLRSLAGPLCFAYLPGGPALDCPPDSRPELLASLGAALRRHLPPFCLFIRFDPPWFEVEEGLAGEGEGPQSPAPGQVPSEAAAGAPSRPTFSPPLRKAESDVQPPDSVFLDLHREEDEILAGMKPKWRYNVRLAAKKGILVSEEGLEGLPEFYRLYEETSRRDRIAIHPLAYYEKLFELARAGGEGLGRPGLVDLRLWVARHEGEAVAAIVTLYHGNRATYLYGASSDSKRSLMPAYALQWAAIMAARQNGCAIYDFYGIPPSEDPDHPMAGLYRFKTGFGGSIVHYAGSWDLPLSPALYALWSLAESLRAFWFKKLKKRLGGGLSTLRKSTGANGSPPASAREASSQDSGT